MPDKITSATTVIVIRFLSIAVRVRSIVSSATRSGDQNSLTFANDRQAGCNDPISCNESVEYLNTRLAQFSEGHRTPGDQSLIVFVELGNKYKGIFRAAHDGRYRHYDAVTMRRNIKLKRDVGRQPGPEGSMTFDDLDHHWKHGLIASRCNGKPMQRQFPRPAR